MKGYYSVLIGVIALIVLSTALFTVNSFNKSQALIPQKESFSFTVKQWQNTQRLLDKASADAIIDSGYSADCLTGLFNPDSNIYNYDQNVLTLTNSDCSIENFIVTKSIPINSVHSVGERNIYDINVSMDLQCRHKLEIGLDLNSLALYEKNILFEKTLDANYNSTSTDCNLLIIDKQSGLQDVNHFVI